MLSTMIDLCSLVTPQSVSNLFILPEIHFTDMMLSLLKDLYLEFTRRRITDEIEKKSKNNFLFDEQLNYLVKEWDSVFEDTENMPS